MRTSFPPLASKTGLLLMLCALFVSPAIPASEVAVTVYPHCGYEGDGVDLPPGDYNMGDLRVLGVRNDDLSSIRVPKRYTVTIYEHDRFQGRSRTLSRSDECLIDSGFNDVISSLSVSRTQAAPSEPICLPDARDPCRNCNHFDRLDYVYVKKSGGGLTLVPKEAKVLRDWKYMDEACDPPVETDLSDHYPLMVTFAVKGPRAPAGKKEITFLNYNAHLFYGSKGAIAELSKKEVFIYQDRSRLEPIASKILKLDAEIVALQEVWDEGLQQWFVNRLRERYSHAQKSSGYGAASEGLRNTSGVVLLSKLPLGNVRFREFPVHYPIILTKPGTTLFEIGGSQDAWARKGVLTADVEVEPGATFRLGVSHAHTAQTVGKGKWSKNYNRYGITTFTLNGDAYIFALKAWPHHERVIARLYDYSWDYGGERYFDAGWRITDVREWSSLYKGIVSFELGGHPYLFALHANDHKAFIRRITDDGNGWADVWSDRWSSLYKGSALTSFQLNGHPHIFGLKTGGKNKGKAHIVRIKDDGNGYEHSTWGYWGLENPQIVVPFELNGRPYLFETRGPNARIARIDFDPSTERVTGWKYVYEKRMSDIPPNCFGPDEDGRAGSGIVVERIYSDLWGNDFFVSRSFELSGHPHLFSLKAMTGESLGTLPGEGYLTRIKDDGRGWQNLVNLPHMQIIIDETVRDDAPAVMMGDFNVHLDHYGNMNRMFETFGATDAYSAVHGSNMQGAETIDACGNTLTQVFKQEILSRGGLLEIAKVVVGGPASLQQHLADGKVCLHRLQPESEPREEKESASLCGQPYERGEVTSITPFELNGEPHIFVLTGDTTNAADIYRIRGDSVDRARAQ